MGTIPECDVCGDTTGTHKQWCGEGSGREDTRDVIVSALGIDPTHAENDCFVYHTGGGCMAIVALIPDGRELWVTNIGGTLTGPERDDPSDGWLIGVYPDGDAPFERPEDATYAESHDQSLTALSALIGATLAGIVWDPNVCLYVWQATGEPLDADECEAHGLDSTGRFGG